MRDGTSVTGDGIYADGTPCAADYPVGSDPRRVAGAPLANDIVACVKQPVSSLNGPGPHGGTVALRDDQVARLEVVFPDGFRSKARPLKVDADWDLAALVIWRPPAAPVKIAAHSVAIS